MNEAIVPAPSCYVRTPMSRVRKALCVSAQPGSAALCTVVDQVIASSGFVIEHVPALQLPLSGDIALVLVDRAARLVAGDALRSCQVPVVVVGDNLDDSGLISLMLEAPVSHLLEDPNDRTLGVTAAKLASGDVFGLEKYLEPGPRVAERCVEDDVGKRRAMDEVVAWAEAEGARRPVLHRIASVVDELLMNALNGRVDGRDGASLRRARLRWAADGKTFALSVSDDNGTLRQRDVIDHVRRAKDERGRPEPAGPNNSGAGLGLYLVLANVASLVVNLAPGRCTEVIALFDLSQRARPQLSRARSLHVFAS